MMKTIVWYLPFMNRDSSGLKLQAVMTALCTSLGQRFHDQQMWDSWRFLRATDSHHKTCRTIPDLKQTGRCHGSSAVRNNLNQYALPCDLRLYGNNLQVSGRHSFKIVEQLSPRERSSANELIDILERVQKLGCVRRLKPRQYLSLLPSKCFKTSPIPVQGLIHLTSASTRRLIGCKIPVRDSQQQHE